MSAKNTYRDATFSRATCDDLVTLYRWLRFGSIKLDRETALVALADVIERWDANEATEIVRDVDGEWVQA